MDTLDIVDKIITARDRLEQAKNHICKCSGFVLQYEGRCQCGRRSDIREFEEEINELINKL